MAQAEDVRLPLEILGSIRKPTRFDQVPFTSSARVLFLAPHPDDFDSAAVTLKNFHERDHDIRLVVLTGGAAGVADSFAEPPTEQQKDDLREQEQKDALAFFGLPSGNVEFPRLAVAADGELLNDERCRSFVRDLLTRERPDLVVLPHGNDTNEGHRRTYTLFRELAAQAGKPVLALYHRDPKTIAMRIDLYTPFGADEAAWKCEMLRHHHSQHVRNLETRRIGFDDRIVAVNRTVASELGIDDEFAEGFEVEVFQPATA